VVMVDTRCPLGSIGSMPKRCRNTCVVADVSAWPGAARCAASGDAPPVRSCTSPRAPPALHGCACQAHAHSTRTPPSRRTREAAGGAAERAHRGALVCIHVEQSAAAPTEARHGCSRGGHTAAHAPSACTVACRRRWR
jgi:hypothetical protein